ncbi:hypothetical protein KC909_00120 [Candidatus Dojkabacteria bacterium]|uniref:Uncharacterized protein n=1 Tax=Candidatus Dojkabacteria bacterium TaxID=2099670 RepID=A0A955L4I3_9BACT|nr:hypothetical protein [Candidatus Dojkabacteria bacterium]
MYNLSQISSEFNVTGPFSLTGTQEAPEATLCARVSTTWNGFEFLDTNVTPGTQLRVFTTQGQSFAISAREYSYAEGNLGGGTALYASGTTIIHESMSGSPVVLESDHSQVIGILMGGSSQDIFIAPYRDLR